MKIANSLRPECMPEMVYSLCKLVTNKPYSKEDLRKLVTLGDEAKESTEQFNKVYRFAIDCEFISERSDGIVIANFDAKTINEYRRFRYEIFKNVSTDDGTIFSNTAEWYLTQGREIFAHTSAKTLLSNIPLDLKITNEEYLLGFRFWMEALGMASIQKSTGNTSALVFATHQILTDWLEFSIPFEKGDPVSTRDFFNKLAIDCSIFSCCIKNNDLSLSLSMGLRVLHINKVIELEYVTDSGDIWHLTPSVSYANTNDITDIIVR